MSNIQLTNLALPVEGLDPLPINHCFSKGERLAAIVQQARQIILWNQRLLRELPPEMMMHCRVININTRVLIVAADSSAWAMRLRYLVPSLLIALNAGVHDGEKIVGIRSRVGLIKSE